MLYIYTNSKLLFIFLINLAVFFFLTMERQVHIGQKGNKQLGASKFWKLCCVSKYWKFRLAF